MHETKIYFLKSVAAEVTEMPKNDYILGEKQRRQQSLYIRSFDVWFLKIKATFYSGIT